MFGYRHKESCGRYAPKPENKVVKDEVELYEEAVPVAQQIENLRTKISLQERYNAALKDNFEETAKGSSQVLRSMIYEVYNLRLKVKEALNRERWVVNSALRSHRLFQLALRYTSPGDAVEWMEDKLFDQCKTLDNLIDRLIKKRKKLEETELAVEIIEKWPIPGSLPWEIRLETKRQQAETAYSNVQLKLDCSRVLRNTYKSIRQKLRLERDLYAPVIINLSAQLTTQTHELNKLEEMLGHAQKFQADAEETLALSEKDASTNRRQRRAQIAKMRKEMQKITEDDYVYFGTKQNDPRNSFSAPQEKAGLYHQTSILIRDDLEQMQKERVIKKKAQIDLYNDWAMKLVKVMKIPNLVHIPKRMDSVLQLLEILKAEKDAKETYKNTMIKHRNQLTQLYCVMRYRGNNELEENNRVIEDYEATFRDLEKQVEMERTHLNKDHSLLCDFQMGISSLLHRVEGADRKAIHVKKTEHVFLLVNTFHEKLQQLVDRVKELREEMGTKSKRSMANVTRKGQPYQTPARFVRVGSPVVDDQQSDEEYAEDFKVPGRLELKQQSDKIYHQGILRRGFAAARRLELEQKGKRKKQERSSFDGRPKSQNIRDSMDWEPVGSPNMKKSIV